MASYPKLYSKIKWENYPSETTPINENNLNKMDNAIDKLDDRSIELNTLKLDVATANTMVKSVVLDKKTGIITVTLLNGSKTTYDTALEKVAVNFKFNKETGHLVLTLDDGSTQDIDLSAMLHEYTFKDDGSNTMNFSDDGKGNVKAGVRKGSITDAYIEPNYLANIKTESAKASKSESEALNYARKAQSYAVGGTNTRTGEDTDNAKYYSETTKAMLESIDAGRLQTEIDDVRGQIHTNLLNPTTPTQTTNGVTFTNNGDGTYTVNGTASNSAYFRMTDQLTDLDLSRKYKIVGCPQGGGVNTYILYDEKNSTYQDAGNGVVYTPTNQPRFYIRITSGTTCNNLLFKPMLTTDLNATYDDFVPYTGDSGRLNEDVANLVKGISPITNSDIDTILNS